MFNRLVFVAIGACVLASCFLATSSEAQTCQWTDKGGKDVTWVKLMWFERDSKSKENPKPIIGFQEKSKYKRYKGKADKKRHRIDPDLLRDWVPEIFGETGDEPADAYYFLSDDAFQPSEEYKDAEEIPLKVGREFEKGPDCSMFGDKYKGYRKVEEIRDGKVTGVKWYSPIAIDKMNRAKQTDPLMYFGILAGVLVVCIIVGIVGVKIGDKERGLEE